MKTPIIALTGNALQSDRDLFFEAGVNDFQTKASILDNIKKNLNLNLQIWRFEGFNHVYDIGVGAINISAQVRNIYEHHKKCVLFFLCFPCAAFIKRQTCTAIDTTRS